MAGEQQHQPERFPLIVKALRDGFYLTIFTNKDGMLVAQLEDIAGESDDRLSSGFTIEQALQMLEARLMD